MMAIEAVLNLSDLIHGHVTPKKDIQLPLKLSKKLAGQKHRGKDFGVVFLDVFLPPEFRSGASFSPKNHAEPVLNRMTLLVLNCIHIVNVETSGACRWASGFL